MLTVCDCGSVYASACVRLQAFASKGAQGAGVEEAAQVSSPVPRRSRVWELLLRGPSRRPSCCLTWSLLWLRPTLWALDSTQTCAPRSRDGGGPHSLPRSHSQAQGQCTPRPSPLPKSPVLAVEQPRASIFLTLLGLFFFFLSLSFSTCRLGGGTDLHHRFAVRIKVKNVRMLSEYSRLPAPSIC